MDAKTPLTRIWQSRWTPAVAVLGVIALLGIVYYARKSMPRQTFQLDGNMLVSGNPHLHEVCLTFDDGPHTGSLDSILDTLKQENVKATFFVVGKMVDLHPELVRRALAEGNEVGNHTYTHKRLNQMPLASARQEILACAASVKRATGSEMNLLRPPGMEYNAEVLKLIQSLGYVTVHWNVVAGDYVEIDPGLVYKRVMEQTKDGSVILLHDAPATAKALPSIIRDLKAKGYQFVTTTQMLARLPRPVTIPSNAYQVKEPVVQAPAKVERSSGRIKPAPEKPAPAKPKAFGNGSRAAVDDPAWGSGETDPPVNGGESSS